MRQRRVKNLDEKLQALSSHMIDNPQEYRGRWNEVFGNDNPIFLEIGCGKGQFISACAENNPGRNYIGIEGQSVVLLRALEKAEALGTDNLVFICDFVQDMEDFFTPGELSGIFLNFSDPWPKARHNKRRLTYRGRLENYVRVLQNGGCIEIKTDNDALFDFTLEEIAAADLLTVEKTYDLHSAESTFSAKEITTEYEDKFRGMGKNINYVKVRGR